MSTSQPSEFDDAPIYERIARNPRPAALWTVVFAGLLALEFGALVVAVTEALRGTLAAVPGSPGAAIFADAAATAREIPTLLSREVIPNAGHRTPSGAWVETFPTNFGAETGLEPKHAWLLRVVLIYTYAITFLYWVYRGYLVFRREYRYAHWTPRDDVIDRFRSHRWGQFGLIVVFMFVVMAVFAPALGPTTVDKNIVNAASNEIEYYNDEAGEVQTIRLSTANLNSQSSGSGDSNVPPWSYDDYGRFHPFGTMTLGQDLFTFMASGARISLFVGIVGIGISAIIATVFALVTAYYKGLVDLAVVISGDTVMSIPQLLILILLSVVFQNHWLSTVYNGAFLIALIFGFTGWPFLWRAVRGPAFQVSEEEWIDAARSYGQSSITTMRKHMLPYIVGYLLVYASMTLGGYIILTSALSFLGLGITAPTPEWGRAIAAGQDYVATQSGHISLIPGILIVLVVTGFNALGDGIRDAIDPQADVGGDGDEVAAAGGGG